MGYWYNVYDEGAAHPEHIGSYINYDLNNGSEIKLDQLLVPNYSDKLNQIAEKSLLKLMEKKVGIFNLENLNLTTTLQ